MASLLLMLKLGSGAGSVQEDALMTVGALTEIVGVRFLNYLDAFKEHLIAGLQSKEEYQVKFMMLNSLYCDS